MPPPARPLLLGVVSYCPEVLSIWDGMRFASNHVLDYVAFTSYERQTDALLRGHVDIAWNGPLAHCRVQRLAKTISLGMRDVDRDFRTLAVSKKTPAAEKRFREGPARVGAGTWDSPQAYVLPFQFMKEMGRDFKDLDVTRFDRDVGKHGDTALGEVQVLSGVLEGKFDFGFVSNLEFERCKRKDELQAVHEFPGFDHCQFDCLETLPDAIKTAFTSMLFAMDMKNNERDRKVMQMEGIREKWERPRESGYDVMRRAIANEALEVYPAPMHTLESHPFKSLVVS